jgi:hypothetical protein
MKYDNNKNLLFFACQYNGHERFALQLWKLYPAAAIDQDHEWANYQNHMYKARIKMDLSIFYGW